MRRQRTTDNDDVDDDDDDEDVPAKVSLSQSTNVEKERAGGKEGRRLDSEDEPLVQLIPLSVCLPPAGAR